MGSLDERVAYLEGRMEDHSALIADIRGEMRGLRSEIERHFERVDRRFDRMDQRFERMDQRFDHADQKFDRQFTWLVGILVGVLLGLVGLAFQIARLQPV